MPDYSGTRDGSPFFPRGRKTQNDVMTETGMNHGVEAGCGVQRSLGVWLLSSESEDDDAASKVGETTASCCCSHPECEVFREESWCQRFCVIGVESKARVGQTLDVSTGEAVVRAILATRSCWGFQVIKAKGPKFDWKLIVFLAEGEPPLTNEELQRWNDEAYHVSVTGGTCCHLRAKEALCRLLHFYCHHAVENTRGRRRTLLHRLIRFCLGTAAGEREIIRELTAGDCTSCR